MKNEYGWYFSPAANFNSASYFVLKDDNWYKHRQESNI
jgi:hypothetical protein